ncbi:MAG TPA: molybdopterin-guanine dinucleotide biosynthesis protein B [Phycisphaerae bacterium]|nr:molybdopterin-guanine dinucleotide biosynthesis protein B [Phycisphaerae bacterium]
MADTLPILGIFGHHNAGKTTLIEQLLPHLAGQGLAVAVAKVHGADVEIDVPGKDSDRLYRAGADVWMQGRAEGFFRQHGGADEKALAWRLADLARQYDVVLVEGRRPAACDKVWLLGEGETAPPPDAGRVLAVLARGDGRARAARGVLDGWLARQWLEMPVYACVLIGGKSSRMGRPKHLIESGGRTWLERTVGLLGTVAARVVIAGDGCVPESLSAVARLADAPEAEGPMAGVLAAMRWAPDASWLVAACDLPNLSAEALGWLLATRAPGVWATLPRLPGAAGVEPLLAHYDPRARGLIERLPGEGNFRLSALARHPKVISPTPPANLAPAWTNANTPADL